MTPDEVPLPHSAEAERAVLGSLLIDPAAIFKVNDSLRSGDFYVERHGWIYEAMCHLASRRVEVDFVTLCDELDRKNRLAELGGAAYLTGLLGDTPTALNVEFYAEIVERSARDRRLVYVGGQIAALGYDEGMDSNEKEAKAQQWILDATGRSAGSLVSIEEVGSRYYDHVGEMSRRKAEVLGLKTGFPTLDRMLSGLQKGRLYIIAGRPGMGKTSLALSVAMTVASAGGKVGVFSLEMSDLQLMNRWVAAATGIDSQRLMVGKLKDEEWKPFTNAVEEISQRPIYIDDNPILGITSLRSKAKRIYLQHGLDLAIIDYLQLMEPDMASGSSRTREREVALISRGGKVLAKELGIPVMMVCQLNRSVESRSDKHPVLSDLRGSGGLEQDADGVIFVYRDDYYDKESPLKGIAEIDVAKQRDGPTGRVPLLFTKETSLFREAVLEIIDLNIGKGYSAV
jgi:replicative DNA helicase